MTTHNAETAVPPQSATSSNDWIERFKVENGRSPKVLHIGNIANNAYINAKLLRKVGFTCDVLCYDYYHIMGCPEWEDADFTEVVVDPFAPDWTFLDPNTFTRADWFVQGPLDICIDYLLAKQRLGKQRQARQWAVLAVKNGTAKATFLNKVLFRFVQGRKSALRKFSSLHRKLRKAPSKLVSRLKTHVLRHGELAQHAKQSMPLDAFSRRVHTLETQFKALFPEHSAPLEPDDLSTYRPYISSLTRLFSQYDVIHTYATDGIWPLLVNKTPYVSYEHGTIRNIPFEPTAQGRKCLLSYKLSDWVVITNCDNLKAAKRMELEQFSFVPHPINEDFLEDAQQQSVGLRGTLLERLNADFLVFHPSRQHWEARRHPDWEKGNDIFIKGFAQFVTEVNPKAAAIFVDWGKCVEQSKALLQELGVADRVLWIHAQPNRQMLKYIHATDVLADQFFLGAFGSTMPKALACGKPAMLYLDVDMHRWCFDEMPPVINAQEPQAVFAGLSRLYKDKLWAQQLSMQGNQWYHKYHSNAVIAQRLSQIYQTCISTH